MQELKLENIEKLSKTELKLAKVDCFETAPEADPVDRLAILQEAQFYTRELERRIDSRVSIRDFVLEIVVIALIGWEIYMGYWQDAQQSAQFEKQQEVMTKLEQSADATAATLTALQTANELNLSTSPFTVFLQYAIREHRVIELRTLEL